MSQDGTRDSIELEAVYPHPIAQVWRALTESEALGRWLMPNDFQPLLGHHFTFRTVPQAGWDGIVECQVVALDAPHRVAYTWRGAAELPETLVTFTLESLAAGSTRLCLVHSGFAQGGPAAQTIRDLLSSGWDATLLRTRLPALLDALAADGAGAAPCESEEKNR
jgi:uncharacterized protein YndB with AHSA1/START domain